MPDVPGNIDTTATILPGETIIGTLEELQDQDWYRIDLSAGDVITIYLNGYGDNPAYDPYVSVFDAGGHQVAGDDDSGGGPNEDARLIFTAPTAGTYYIGAETAFGYFTGDYSLTLVLAPAVSSSGVVDSVWGCNATPDTAAYDPSASPSTVYSISDSGGVDTLDFSAFSVSQRISLSHSSSVAGGTDNLYIADGTIIENAIGGSGFDDIYAHDGDNILDGGPGADRLWGEGGDDTYFVDNPGDYIVEMTNDGYDTVYASVSYALSAWNEVESLILTGTAVEGAGNNFDNHITGNASDNRLLGYEGNDFMDGGAGVDIMRGGAGDDVYYVDSSSDRAIERIGEGTDLVYSSSTYSLGTNVENLTLTGSAVRGNGNSLANRIIGNDGNNIINGGASADSMRGGAGNDTYYVDEAGDRVVENAGEGVDRVYSTVTYSATLNVDQIFLRGSEAIDANGNALDNTLVGNSAANILNGRLGADDLRGGGGADTFYFDDGHFGGLTPSTCDRIIDFTHTDGDRIDLGDVDANSSLADDQAFTFIGTASFHNVAGELRYQQVNANTYVYGDTNGDGAADFMIRLDGLHDLVSGDFVI